ncbi:DUF4232 domain-containing protein [Kibdelosporangium phytohabitans]|uniref:DUF4232 domain-containing protein n=1 Tax=Kibdelosporangium phytohabitans TaxID=860235 RepID=A0A0N9HJA6_9PSEU|nr:DUF4232 domain-containing protein [Kibdelosporangium phytohabitans]ALG06097.1 hypothetical protein AOZ06_03445 [Kibdelosporangium phytohabitans]MBE1465815.1 hypothetical protein [Kibdelosporangium phytohabitans]
MVRHKVLVAGAAVVALGTLAACGGGSDNTTAQPPQTVTVTQSPSSPSGSPTSTSAERPDSVVRSSQVARCAPGVLKGEIEGGDAAAGNRYAKLAVTNTSSKACTLYGYGGLQLTDANGSPTPTKLTRKPDPGPALVTLEPGHKAFKNLHWGAVPGGTEPTTGPCEPESMGAKVIPPDETEPFTIKFDFGSVCQKGSIDGSAYYK